MFDPQKLKIKKLKSQFSMFVAKKGKIILQYFENQKVKIENGQLAVLKFCFQSPPPKIQCIKKIQT